MELVVDLRFDLLPFQLVPIVIGRGVVAGVLFCR
jgi:hypothetical protein